MSCGVGEVTERLENVQSDHQMSSVDSTINMADDKGFVVGDVKNEIVQY